MKSGTWGISKIQFELFVRGPQADGHRGRCYLGGLEGDALQLPQGHEREEPGKVKRYKQRLDPKTGKANYEHRAVAEWKLGRRLSPSEVVHHADGNKGDNHPDNIWVFSSQRAHMMWHHFLWRKHKGVESLFDFEVLLRADGEWWVR